MCNFKRSALRQGYNADMAYTSEDSPFTGFGIGSFSSAPQEGGVFLLVVFRDGVLTAAAYATERGAMAAGAESLDNEPNDDSDLERGTLEDSFARAQQIVTEEGGLLEVIPSPVFGA